MPGLDYKNRVQPGLGGVPLSDMAERYGHDAAAPRTYGGRFYDGSPGRRLVCCPDCGQDADLALGGDHGGDCRPRESAT